MITSIFSEVSAVELIILVWLKRIKRLFFYLSCCCGPLLFQQQPTAFEDGCVLASGCEVRCRLVAGNSASRLGEGKAGGLLLCRPTPSLIYRLNECRPKQDESGRLLVFDGGICAVAG